MKEDMLFVLKIFLSILIAIYNGFVYFIIKMKASLLWVFNNLFKKKKKVVVKELTGYDLARKLLPIVDKERKLLLKRKADLISQIASAREAIRMGEDELRVVSHVLQLRDNPVENLNAPRQNNQNNKQKQNNNQNKAVAA